MDEVLDSCCRSPERTHPTPRIPMLARITQYSLTLFPSLSLHVNALSMVKTLRCPNLAQEPFNGLPSL